jgi:TDG/mug DNA glycosylase family protein
MITYADHDRLAEIRRRVRYRSGMTSRPTPAEIAAAKDRTIPDVVPPRGGVLFCGINPGLYSAATGWHFARPGNRFWPALHRSGFTDRLLAPAEQHLLPSYGLGITNLAARATATAAELTPEELAEGGGILQAFVREHAPRAVAVLGVTAYRTAFGDKKAAIGPQDVTIGGSRLWVLPNPSGLNAHYTAATLAEEFRLLRAAVGGAAGEKAMETAGEAVTK